jgi:DNA-binding phage protein
MQLMKMTRTMEEYAKAVQACLEAEQARSRVIQWRARHLIERHGSVRQAGTNLGIDPAYLYKLSVGQKANPSQTTLELLGLVPEER